MRQWPSESWRSARCALTIDKSTAKPLEPGGGPSGELGFKFGSISTEKKVQGVCLVKRWCSRWWCGNKKGCLGEGHNSIFSKYIRCDEALGYCLKFGSIPWPPSAFVRKRANCNRDTIRCIG